MNNIYPKQYESHIQLKNDAEVFFRPIMASDRDLIVDLFNKISLESIYLRFLRRIDSLSEDMVNQLININYNTDFALVSVIKENGQDAIIAVGRYGHDPDQGSTELAVAVRDDWQHIGLGKSMLREIVSIAKDHGISHFTGMMAPQNNIIQKLLVELGYKVKYSLESGFYRVEIVV